VRVLRLNLLGLGLLLGADRLGGPRLPTVHTAVGGTQQSTITAGGTLTSHPLAGGLAGGAEGGDFLAKLGNFGEQGLHWEGSGFGDFGKGGSFVKNDRRGDLGDPSLESDYSSWISVTVVLN